MFAGFVPNKEKARFEALTKYKDVETTLVFYETANRLVKTLEIAQLVFENREIAIAREMTKMFEESVSGTAKELLEHFTKNPPKGEIVMMIAPPSEQKSVDYVKELQTALKQKSLKSAVKDIVEKYQVSKNEVYEKALELKR